MTVADLYIWNMSLNQCCFSSPLYMTCFGNTFYRYNLAKLDPTANTYQHKWVHKVWNWMQITKVFIHQHVSQHWKWQTKKSCRLILSIDLTQRFEKLGIITIVIIPFFIHSPDIQTIFISTTVRLARTPIRIIKNPQTSWGWKRS